jgi:hypothetical protein
VIKSLDFSNHFSKLFSSFIYKYLRAVAVVIKADEQPLVSGQHVRCQRYMRLPCVLSSFGLLKTKINDMNRGLYNGIKHGAGDNMCAQKDNGISNGEGGAVGRMTPKK